MIIELQNKICDVFDELELDSLKKLRLVSKSFKKTVDFYLNKQIEAWIVELPLSQRKFIISEKFINQDVLKKLFFIQTVSLDQLNNQLIHYAAILAKLNLKRVIYLGGDINAVELNGKTPLHRAALCGSVSKVGLLLSMNANKKAVDKFNRTPLDVATSRLSSTAQIGVVQLLSE
jgi:ankyrin repeat protein